LAPLADIGDGGQQLAGLAGIHYDPPVDSLGALRRFPAQPGQRIGGTRQSGMITIWRMASRETIPSRTS